MGKFICKLRLMRKKLRQKDLLEMLPVTVEKSQSRVIKKKLRVKILLPVEMKIMKKVIVLV